MCVMCRIFNVFFKIGYEHSHQNSKFALLVKLGIFIFCKNTLSLKLRVFNLRQIDYLRFFDFVALKLTSVRNFIVSELASERITEIQ